MQRVGSSVVVSLAPRAAIHESTLQGLGGPAKSPPICLHHDIKIAKGHKVLQAFWAIWAYPLPQSQSLRESSRDKLPASSWTKVSPRELRILLTDTTNTLPELARLGLEA